ncbi:MAG: methylenetetrahydrofolate reductase [NAD(P)H] [Ignavibacteria bacterium RIFOXYB2_FULL_35_12]|nr:MAG: methylenetetrahydrofolate reductase [NAD(P)H] [Ignavibacteria bacterium GWA2_36_19]OGU50735.1 MAG: methylenetetrahydrofolate reductase [NAD(P)H] [Ignavibacteria bacterium GWC2_35_8]OGU61410.1 MAG: methylenetetrahydrofolate reductase [NAD(P)H] [Ignavibacteria bacterium GWF2_35_20]OGU78857.1 MAG: methylenetetrahydrofolate reductase [NAD(P)H] [Ignavibacteria bacterium RIFOXYA2_FULL_35_9]OGU85443.1 MAG: methylenetetrahydrofolate reductase [NAD(P)H] [Ignavibacteria bacterium RIFOXYA12_FULL_3
MKVIEHLAKAKDPLISFEIIPPKRGGDIHGILSVLDDIMKYRPPFIDITSHSAEVVYEETPTGIKKKVKRKRPGTLGICALIQNKYDIDAVPHILTKGFTREETEDFLIELNYLGIKNVLAVRGDDSAYEKPIPEGRSANKTAKDLVIQIMDMNRGKYIEDSLLDAKPSNFCIGVGGYPEKHFEAPNLKSDIKFCKEKLEAGADYVVTQMFFDNSVYFNYVEQCRKEGITAPIIPGLKIISAKSHLVNIPKNFHVSLPDELVDEVNSAKPEHVLDIGVAWAAKQVEELLSKNVPSVHFYIMQNSAPVKKLMNRLKIFKKIA